MAFQGCTVIDLSQPIYEGIPSWPGKQKYKYNSLHETEPGGIIMPQGCGTHVDAPLHFHQKGIDISSIPVKNFVAAACIIDISKKAFFSHDYELTAQDVYEWEERNGIIAAGSFVLLNTGWAKYWSKKDSYFNFDDNNRMHFPGFSPEAAQVLVSRNIAGLGIDTASVDPGYSDNFFVHKITSSENIFNIENLCNLDLLPEKGSFIIAAPIKLMFAEESPARVIGFY